MEKIEIFCNAAESEPIARLVGYGIEEEGLPYEIEIGEFKLIDAYDASRRARLGVAVFISEERVSVFTRQLHENRPLFDHEILDGQKAKIIGENAARIIKNKPFIDLAEVRI